MPGPIGEKCSECYWWDIDRKYPMKEKVKSKNGKLIDKLFDYADCCYGDPGSKPEIKSMREDLFCSEFTNREYGIDERNRLDELTDEDNEEKE